MVVQLVVVVAVLVQVTTQEITLVLSSVVAVAVAVAVQRRPWASDGPARQSAETTCRTWCFACVFVSDASSLFVSSMRVFTVVVRDLLLCTQGRVDDVAAAPKHG